MFSALFYRHSNCKYIQYPNPNSIFVPVICAPPSVAFLQRTFSWDDFLFRKCIWFYFCVSLIGHNRAYLWIFPIFSHVNVIFRVFFLFRLYNVEIQPTKIRHLHLLIASIKGNIRVFRCVIASVKSLVIYLRLALFLLICSIKML